MSKASIWVPKIMPCQDIGNIRLAKQSRNIYISWKWVKVQKLAQAAKFFEMDDGKEGRAGASKA